jgi:hypothetical protein
MKVIAVRKRVTIDDRHPEAESVKQKALRKLRRNKPMLRLRL